MTFAGSCMRTSSGKANNLREARSCRLKITLLQIQNNSSAAAGQDPHRLTRKLDWSTYGTLVDLSSQTTQELIPPSVDRVVAIIFVASLRIHPTYKPWVTLILSRENPCTSMFVRARAASRSSIFKVGTSVCHAALPCEKAACIGS